MSPFKANYGQDPRMGFEGRKKEKYKGAKRFVEKMKEKAKAVLGKEQEEIKKYANRKQVKVNNYRVGDLVMLSTKDLKYQMVRGKTEKLIERFIGLYTIKKIVSLNTVELELPNTINLYSVINVSRIQKYIGQVEGQKKKQLAPVIIKGEKEWKIERILNKQWIRGKNKYLVYQKRFIVELDTWKERENLKNTKEVIKEFKKEY